MRPPIALLAALIGFTVTLGGCQPSHPPPTPLPTKEKTIDKVKADIDRAMQQAQSIRDAEDQPKKGD
ncbi:MAG: hypothetical protein LC098_09660 [Burkholderiales bacterium]|nr:hypothetical protein [Burkholderiales bacterium]